MKFKILATKLKKECNLLCCIIYANYYSLFLSCINDLCSQPGYLIQIINNLKKKAYLDEAFDNGIRRVSRVRLLDFQQDLNQSLILFLLRVTILITSCSSLFHNFPPLFIHQILENPIHLPKHLLYLSFFSFEQPQPPQIREQISTAHRPT
uniref:Uncharacterized protein n=1 Tax=Opuntia streptacantha TaxID=393608 RepID=A0A7C8Z2Z9_OPUST